MGSRSVTVRLDAVCNKAQYPPCPPADHSLIASETSRWTLTPVCLEGLRLNQGTPSRVFQDPPHGKSIGSGRATPLHHDHRSSLSPPESLGQSEPDVVLVGPVPRAGHDQSERCGPHAALILSNNLRFSSPSISLSLCRTIARSPSKIWKDEICIVSSPIPMPSKSTASLTHCPNLTAM